MRDIFLRTRKDPTNAQEAPTSIPTIMMIISGERLFIWNILGRNNWASMWINFGMLKLFLEHLNNFRCEGVLHIFCIAMNVITWQLKPFGEIEFPKPVISNNMTRLI